MVIVDKSHISSVLLMETYAELHELNERIKWYEEKYQQTFKEFEKMIHKGKEDFKLYDDYIEWKAYYHKKKEIEQKIKDLKSGEFQVS